MKRVRYLIKTYSQIDLFYWKNTFEDTSVDEKVNIFNKTVLDILHNFIPHETFLVDDKDPPWLTKTIKNLINKKKSLSIFVKIVIIYKY